MFIVQLFEFAPKNIPTGFCLYICIKLLVELDVVVVGTSKAVLGFGTFSFDFLALTLYIILVGWGGGFKIFIFVSNLLFSSIFLFNFG